MTLKGKQEPGCNAYDFIDDWKLEEGHIYTTEKSTVTSWSIASETERRILDTNNNLAWAWSMPGISTTK